MKAINFLMIAILVLACHKKNDDPKPATPDPTITVYLTKGDYYPNGTGYENATIYISNQNGVILNGTGKNTDATGKALCTSPSASDNYSLTYDYKTYHFTSGIAIPKGTVTQHIDSFYVKTIYQ